MLENEKYRNNPFIHEYITYCTISCWISEEPVDKVRVSNGGFISLKTKYTGLKNQSETPLYYQYILYVTGKLISIYTVETIPWMGEKGLKENVRWGEFKYDIW
jgi:hypothetical protein